MNVRTIRIRGIRLLLVAACLGLWFWTQSLIGRRPVPVCGIVDWTHQVSGVGHAYLLSHPAFTNGLLIVSSLAIDLLGVYLMAYGVFGPTIRPFLGLILIFILRQLCQALTALPAPQDPIWHSPGFPSLLVTYGVSSDLFFSGHSAIAVFGATELVRFRNGCLRLVGVLVCLFEITVVLVLRAHYFIDVFTGIIVALWVASFVGCLADRLEKLYG